MLPQDRKEIARAADGLRARRNGEYAEAKLTFIDRYGPPALTVTQKAFRRRYYVDLFAGPGVNVAPNGREFTGSALRALTVVSSGRQPMGFTHAVLVNRDREDHEALQLRVDRLVMGRRTLVPRANIDVRCGDSNSMARGLFSSIDPYSYLFVFLDPESPNQLPWSTIEAIATCAPRSTDVYLLYPESMGVTRLLAYDQRWVDANAKALTRFYGTEEWRPILARRATRAQAAGTRRDLAILYMARLGAYWPYVRCVRDISRENGRRLYKMLHCTRHPIAVKLREWEARRQDQFDLGLESA